ncbi:hypothetical protein Bca101_102060 [Brassica carinata]
MIGRADIEGSKSSVAMSGLAATSQLSLWTPALSFNRCAPQPNSPPDNVLRRIDRERVLGLKKGLLPASDSRRPSQCFVLIKQSDSPCRTSSELAVRRGKARKSVPSPSPADTRRSLATLAAQAAANSRRVELGPRAQPSSQSFSKGCSPWRPDAVMSATGRGGFRSSVFKGAGMHGHHAACGALPAAGPYLRLSRFRSGQAICTDGAPPGSRPRFCSDRAPSYSSRPGSCPAAGIGRASAPSISGLVDSAGSANQLPYALRVYSPVDSHTCQTPWSVFQGGSNGSPQAAPRAREMRERAVARAAEPRLRQRRLAGVAKAGLRVERGRALTLSGAPFQELGPGPSLRRFSDYNSSAKASDFQAGLFGSLAVTKGILRVIRLTWGRVEDFGSSRAFGRSGGDLASEFTTACQGAPGILSSDFGQRRAVTRETSFRPISSRGLGAAICDTQAGVPSARRLGAQLAFKDFDGSRDSAIHTKYRISLRGGTTRPVKARCVSPDRRDRPTGAHEGGRATHPKVQLRAFNCNNLNIRYWSWNYAAAGTRLALQWILVKGFRLYSFQLPDSKSRQAYDYWQDQPGSIHKSRQALVMFRKHMERGTGEDLAVIFCQETSVLSRTEFLESPP